MESIKNFIQNHKEDWTTKRQTLHSLAELAGNETKTAYQITKWLWECKPTEIIQNIGGHGVVAIFDSKNPGMEIVFRAELDALPIPETMDIEYASITNGVAHKCGHDGHMMHLIAVAAYIKENPLTSGKVTLLFQPSEETGEGAKAILDDPSFSIDEKAKMYALHNLPGFPKHAIITRKGVFASASTGLILKLKGKTAHAAQPETGKSPINAVKEILDKVDEISQSQSNNKGTVITVIHVIVGEKAFGTSPADAEICFTIRAPENHQLDEIKSSIVKLGEVISKNEGLTFSHEEVESFNATINNDVLVDEVTRVAQKLSLEIISADVPFRWSEDFGLFTGHFDGVLFGLGAGIKAPNLHDYSYDYPDELLLTGASILIGILHENNCFN